MAETEGGDLESSGIFKLIDILKDHLSVMAERDAAVEKIIAQAETADDLRQSKENALAVEKELLKSIMQDIGEMNDFLNNIILIENLFNQLYEPHKKTQEEARNKFAPSIKKFDKGAAKQSKKALKSEASSFVTLMFGASNALNQFQKWLDEKVMKQCKKEGIKMKEERPKAKLKGMERAFYKSFYVYGKDDVEGYKRMTDLVRVSLVFETFEDLYKCYDVIDTLSEQTLGGVLRVKDRFHPRSVPFGYRDLLINVMCPKSKIVAEIQLHFLTFYKYKKISHKMYKRARLFERENSNLAYDYADKFLRSKFGTQKVYEVTEDDMAEDAEKKENTPDSEQQEDFRTLLTKWGLAKFIDAFEDNGYDDPQYWHEIEENELTDDMGMKKGHLRKWNTQLQKYQDRQKLKKERMEQELKEDDMQNEDALDSEPQDDGVQNESNPPPPHPSTAAVRGHGRGRGRGRGRGHGPPGRGRGRGVGRGHVAPDTAIRVPLYRYWNGKEHFYTTSESEIGTTEKGKTGKYGYKCEGIAGYVSSVPSSGYKPVYRYWNGSDHFYTANINEIGTGVKGMKGKHGHSCEGIMGYCPPNGVPFYRYRNGSEHFYTANAKEIGTVTSGAKGKHGYTSEGIVCYLMP